jgi:hypothetical protein
MNQFWRWDFELEWENLESFIQIKQMKIHWPTAAPKPLMYTLQNEKVIPFTLPPLLLCIRLVLSSLFLQQALIGTSTKGGLGSILLGHHGEV